MSIVHEPLVFVDIETTGGSARFSRVLEVGAVRVENSKVVATYKSLVNPGTLVPPEITRITGITTDDVADAPSFTDIAPELAEILDGAIFVAHNVHFDYSFLKMEFDRLAAPFSPRLLCTVRLSRKLYPEYRSHSLQSIIERFDLRTQARHRAYDDADALWQLYQRMLSDFDLEEFELAVSHQLKTPSVPRHLSKKLIDDLPSAPGVYVFEDEAKEPLYVGKSVNIRSRVMSHFSQFHARAVELRISEQIRGIRFIRTHGELGALLTESQMVKDLQPLHNRMLRRKRRIVLASRYVDEQGYYRLRIDDAEAINPAETGNIMAVYTTMGSARKSLFTAARNFYLCTHLMNLEKGQGACFQLQLKKCWGACQGTETPQAYNERFATAFERQRLHAWPYKSPVLITEQEPTLAGSEGFLVDQWCLLSRLVESEDGSVSATSNGYDFDMDVYKILRQYLRDKGGRLKIKPLTPNEAQSLLAYAS